MKAYCHIDQKRFSTFMIALAVIGAALMFVPLLMNLPIQHEESRDNTMKSVANIHSCLAVICSCILLSFDFVLDICFGMIGVKSSSIVNPRFVMLISLLAPNVIMYGYWAADYLTSGDY
jgi:hypothetical protein